MIDDIKNISKLFSVAGYENNILEFIKNNCENYCDDCYYDNIGNLICHKKGEGKKIMINTPVSSSGMFVTYISENKVKFHAIANIIPESLIGIRVKDINDNFRGVILREETDEEKTEISDLYIDYDENIPLNVGDILMPYSYFENINNNIYGSSLINASSVYIFMELIKEKYKDDLYFVFSVMDNIGFKGAKAAVNSILPEYAFIVTGTDTDNKTTKIHSGKGTVIRIMDSHIIVDKTIREKIIKNLSEKDIPYQLEIVDKKGLTNNEIKYAGNGVKTADICFPVKSSLTFNQAINVKDIDNVIKSLKEILR